MVLCEVCALHTKSPASSLIQVQEFWQLSSCQPGSHILGMKWKQPSLPTSDDHVGMCVRSVILGIFHPCPKGFQAASSVLLLTMKEPLEINRELEAIADTKK